MNIEQGISSVEVKQLREYTFLDGVSFIIFHSPDKSKFSTCSLFDIQLILFGLAL